MIKPQGHNINEINYEPPKSMAKKFVDQISHIETEGRRKIVLNDSSMVENFLNNSIPPEAGVMLQQLMGLGGAENTETQENKDEANNLLQNSLPPEAAHLVQQMIQSQVVAENPDAGVGMVRKRPEYLERAERELKSRDRFELDIENASVLDLIINKSDKTEVINMLKTLSSINYENNQQEPIYYYSDIGINFYFDENDVINEIEIGEKYRHQTTKGLKIGDSLEKATEIYGKPRMKSAKGAIWNRFSILLRDRSEEIELIRMKIRD